MPFTRGAREVPHQAPASTSDARKRIEEAMNTLRDRLRDAGGSMDTSKIEVFLAAGYAANHAPPPVEPAPWSVISTDRENPTLAKVTIDGCMSVDGSWWRDPDYGQLLFGHTDYAWTDLEDIESVELLHTHNPETHVPVERALIDEAARAKRVAEPWGPLYDVVNTLAALADGAES